jgi:hypothetical protein
VGGKELAPLYLYFEGERGSNTFAADPPATLDLRRVCKGKKVKTRAVVTRCLWLLFWIHTSGAFRLWLMRPTRLASFEGALMIHRLRASIMLTVVTIGIFTTIDIIVSTGLGDYIYSLTGMATIFFVAFILAPIVQRKFPLR